MSEDRVHGRTIINELGRAVCVDVRLSGGRMVMLTIASEDSSSTWAITIDEAAEIRRQLDEELREVAVA